MSSSVSVIFGGVPSTTHPIAGTRPRDNDEEKNRQLTDELLSDEKERAEHVMLVDLARNDVGQIAKFGSVKVPEFMQGNESAQQALADVEAAYTASAREKGVL